MTRDEAVNIQYLQSQKKSDGAVLWDGNQYFLCNLNYPQHKPQMARLKDANGNAPEGSVKGGWVKLSEVSEIAS
jgi:hypothetical protein